MAYLFQGEWEKATFILKTYKDQLTEDHESFKEVFLNDLNVFEKLRINTNLFTKAKALLQQ